MNRINHRRFICLVAVLALSTGCQEEEHDPEIVDAFDSWVGAIRAKDAGRVYDLSPRSLHEKVEALHAELSAIVLRVKKEYPKAGRDAALEHLAADIVRGAQDGRALFVGLVDFSRVSFGAEIDSGLKVASVTRGESEATVTTAAGETYRFVLEDDTWKCAAMLTQFETYSSLTMLRANMGIALQNLDSWSRATQETLSMNKPVGAFNVIAAAVARGRRVTVYENLDEASHAQIKEGLAKVRALQAAAANHFKTDAAHHAFLKERQLTWVARVVDEKSLFAHLWDSGKLAAELDFGPNPTVKEVRNLGSNKAVVVLDAGGKAMDCQFTRDLAGNYQLAQLEAALERESVRKVQAAMNALAVPPQ